MNAGLYKICAFCAFTAVSAGVSDAETASTPSGEKYSLSDYRNIMGLSWMDDSPKDIFTYAKRMGHTVVIYKNGMENCSLASGMSFFYNDPDFAARPRMIDFNKKYSPEEIEEFQRNYVVIFPDRPFPQNMATSWFVPPGKYSVTLDFQQQKVIDDVVGRLIYRVKAITKKNPDFKFAGFSWDVPHPSGNFRLSPKLDVADIHRAQGREVSLSHWTGKDSSNPFAGCTHEYETYSEGKLAYYDKLRKEGAKLNSDVKLVSEPYMLYKGWIAKLTPELKEKMKTRKMNGYDFDFLMQECDGVDFLTDPRIEEGGFDSSRVGSSTPNISDTKRMEDISGTAASKGSWTMWYGRAGGTGNAPSYRFIREIPARLKLLKAVPTWENLNNTPIPQRKWSGGVYSSPTAYMGDDAVWGINPSDKNMFLVFLSPKAEVKIPEGKTVKDIFIADGLFCELMNLSEDKRANIPPRVLTVDGKINLASDDLINEGLIVHLADVGVANKSGK